MGLDAASEATRHRRQRKGSRLKEKNFMPSQARCAIHFSAGSGTRPAGGVGVYVRAEEFVEGPGEEVNGKI